MSGPSSRAITFCQEKILAFENFLVYSTESVSYWK